MVTFLGLPRELRDEIYDWSILSNPLYLRQDQYILSSPIDGRYDGCILYKLSHHPVLALFEVNEQISQEYHQRWARLICKVPLHLDIAYLAETPLSAAVKSRIAWFDWNHSQDFVRGNPMTQETRDLVQTCNLNIFVHTPSDLPVPCIYRQFFYPSWAGIRNILYPTFLHAQLRTVNLTWAIETEERSPAKIGVAKRVMKDFEDPVEANLSYAKLLEVGRLSGTVLGDCEVGYVESLSSISKVVRQLVLQSPGPYPNPKLLCICTTQYEAIESPRPGGPKLRTASRQMELL